MGYRGKQAGKWNWGLLIDSDPPGDLPRKLQVPGVTAQLGLHFVAVWVVQETPSTPTQLLPGKPQPL